jgi:hypothetical protein
MTADGDRARGLEFGEFLRAQRARLAPDLVIRPANSLSTLGEFVEGCLKLKLAIEHAIGVGNRHQDGEDLFATRPLP